MKLSIRTRSLVLAVAAGGLLTMPLALPASALAPHVACKTESSPPLAAGKVKSTIGSCSPAALKAGGTSATSVKAGQKAGTVTDTITWKGGKGTTVAIITYGSTTKGKCKAPYDTRVKITGSVKSASGAAKAITKKGEPLSAFICAISKAGPKQGQTILEPNTQFKL